MKSPVLSMVALLLLSQLAEAQAPFDMAPGMFGSAGSVCRLCRGPADSVLASRCPQAEVSFIPAAPMASGRPTPWRRTQPVWLPQSIDRAGAVAGVTAKSAKPCTYIRIQHARASCAGDAAARNAAGTHAPSGTSAAGTRCSDAGESRHATRERRPPKRPRLSVHRALLRPCRMSSTRTAFRIADQSSLNRSTAVSDRLTRIARDRGMLASPAIDVYLSGHVAILEGTVRTTHDRDLLANVAGLEPGIHQVYNGLATQSLGDASCVRRFNASLVAPSIPVIMSAGVSADTLFSQAVANVLQAGRPRWRSLWPDADW